MPSKTYTEEFKRDAVALYENSPEASIQTIATDLGINRATLHNWLKKYGTGARTKTSTTASPTSTSVTEAERIRQLERENARLREERDILRKAAKYFAEETNW
jgi:transposase-like protein